MTAPAPTLSTTRRPHIVWLDVMRLVAILMVVICHCTDPLNASAEAILTSAFGAQYGEPRSVPASRCS